MHHLQSVIYPRHKPFKNHSCNGRCGDHGALNRYENGKMEQSNSIEKPLLSLSFKYNLFNHQRVMMMIMMMNLMIWMLSSTFR